MKSRIWILLACFLICMPCLAQNDTDAGGLAGGLYGTGGAIGGGGAFLGIYDTGSFRKFTHPGFFLDLGVVGPTRKTKADGVFSFNYQSTYNLRRDPDSRSSRPALLFLTGGYSGFFNNGNGVNYGGGLIWRHPRPYSDYGALRLEYRETFVPGWGRQPGFRIAYETGGNLD